MAEFQGQSRVSEVHGSGQELLSQGFRVMLTILPTMGKNGRRSGGHSQALTRPMVLAQQSALKPLFFHTSLQRLPPWLHSI